MRQLGLFQRPRPVLVDDAARSLPASTSGDRGCALQIVKSDVQELDVQPDNSDSPQPALFRKGEWWHEHWRGMPEFIQENQMPYKTVYVHFESDEDIEAFGNLVGQRLTRLTRSIWYPEAEINHAFNKRYVEMLPTQEIDEDVEAQDIEVLDIEAAG